MNNFGLTVASVDKQVVVQKLSPCLSFEGLFQHMQLLVQLGQLLAFA
jgi:hypothetical protein